MSRPTATRIGQLASTGLLGLHLLSPGAAVAQPRQWSGPHPPAGRMISSAEDCAALQKEWDSYKDQWGREHQACLDSLNRGNVQAGPTCSKAPCQQLHYLVYEYASSESSRAMDQCRAIVSQITKQKAEYEAARRRYNEHVAEQNRRLLEALTQRNAEIAEQNRLAQEAVAERNRAAQREFERLVGEYNLRVELADQANATMEAMREALQGGSTRLSAKVSDLLDEFGSTTFDDVVDDAGETAGSAITAFDVANVFTDYEPPERVSSVLESVDRFSSIWNMFQAGKSTMFSDDPQQRFDDQISGLSASAPYLFRHTPWAGAVVSDHIEGIGRWGNAMSRMLDDTMDGDPWSDEQVKEAYVRSFFPRFMWLNDRIKQIQGSATQLHDFFGR